jgi:hypothetical protein
MPPHGDQLGDRERGLQKVRQRAGHGSLEVASRHAAILDERDTSLADALEEIFDGPVLASVAMRIRWNLGSIRAPRARPSWAARKAWKAMATMTAAACPATPPKAGMTSASFPIDNMYKCSEPVRERQILGRGQHLDGAGGDPAVAAVGGGVRDRDLVPGQGIERAGQGLAVLLHRKHELAVAL